MKYKLPDGWEWKKLGELGILKGGNGFKKEFQNYSIYTIPFYKVSDMNIAGNEIFMSYSNNTISQEMKKELKVNLFPKGTIIFAKVGAALLLNRRRITTKESAIDNNMMGFIPNNAVDLVFSFYWLTNIDFANFVNDGAIPSVNQKTLSLLDFPLPPLPEQKRIVAKLDAIFSRLDKAISQTEENLQKLDELWQSVLGEVFEGNEEWERKTLNELIYEKKILSHLDGNHGSSYPRKEEFVDFGVPYIGANSLSAGKVDFSNVKFLPEKRASKFKKGVAKSGDVLFAHNATVGPVAILQTNLKYVILSTSVTYYRCNENFIKPLYLYFYMKSTYFIHQYQQVMKQATRNQVPITKQRTFKFLLPTLPKQQEIVVYLDSMSAKIEKSKEETKRKIESLKALKASVLDRAFRGEI
ncbi:MAG: restriction endonuclease subunit S [Candidatus Cloacimonetes bacterium]|nr:restriction endonuclease subunit S [Candidatus Cloacimonadota bacterium]